MIHRSYRGKRFTFKASIIIFFFWMMDGRGQLVESSLNRHVDLVHFVNGIKVDSISCGKITADSIYRKEWRKAYGYPGGAIFILTNHFVYQVRPEFYKSIPKWLKDRHKIFVVDDKPLRKKRLLLSISESNIEGFVISRDGVDEKIEVFLTPGFALNYR